MIPFDPGDLWSWTAGEGAEAPDPEVVSAVLSARFSVALKCDQTRALALGTAAFPLDLTLRDTLPRSDDLEGASVLYAATRTLASGAQESLDLSGDLPAPLGGSSVFVSLKMALIFAHASNTTRLTVSRPVSNGVPIFAAAGGALSIGPGGMAIVYDPSLGGFASVTAGTGDIIRVANALGAAATYQIVLIGGAES